MMQVGQFVFKRAESPEEFDQIHRLNYRTFVQEIGQYADDGAGRLIDKFHDKNIYLIALRDDRLVGMLCVHDRAPFSVADRLTDPGILTRPGVRPLEVRLLAIEPEQRNQTLFFGLVWTLYNYALENGYSHLFISGYDNRADLYERLGFEVLGPAVSAGQAAFIPMALTIGKLPVRVERAKKQWEARADINRSKPAVCLLPGPVTLSPEVRQAFHQPPIYHRGPEFKRRFLQVRRQLTDLVRGKDVAILNGSGTLANEIIAATLAAEARQRPSTAGRGILLVNGEFGDRLAKQARRFGLDPLLLTWPWGSSWDLDVVEEALAAEPKGTWIWGVHQESSTGVLNDLPGLVQLAEKYGARVCLDCISSLGAVPIDLNGVYLASGTSGKALGSVAGAALVFADRSQFRDLDRSTIPSYLDLPAALESPAPCYTFPSSTLLALDASLEKFATPTQAQAAFAQYRELGVKVRRELRRLGLQPLAAEENACPVVTTFAPPTGMPSAEFISICSKWGYAIGGESAYLSQRQLVQIATMGAMTWEQCGGLFERLGEHLVEKPQLAMIG